MAPSSASASSSDARVASGAQRARAERTAAARRVLARCWIAAAVAAATACATPVERFTSRAKDLGFAVVSLSGDGARHVSFVADARAPSDTLRVYIEHDGTPWLDRSRVADDPTPRTPVALEFMALDQGPRLLLGRPCHFGTAVDDGCTPLAWTHRRYAPEVIASMVAALRSFLAAHPFREIVLVGYSGGGTVAWLMAAQIPETVRVVTVAANLDIGLWAQLHGFSPLAGSLNPTLAPPLPRTVRQFHYVGGRDRIVPPAVVASFVERHPDAVMHVLAEFDHECCWIAGWPELGGNAERNARAEAKRSK